MAIRRSDWRALAPLTATMAARLVREGMLVRALVWPGLLVCLSLVGAAAVFGALGANPSIAVDDPILADALEAAEFDVSVLDDPAVALAGGEVSRAAWREGTRWVLSSRFGDRHTLLAESILRAHIGETWQIRPAAPPVRASAVEGQTRILAALICVLFALYGVVIGAGSLVRDRDEGVLEAEAALAVGGWTLGASRLLAAGGVLLTCLAATLLVLHGLVGVPELGGWVLQGGSASIAGISLGLLFASGRRGSVAFRPPGGEGLSVPLSRSLTLATGALAVGWGAPSVGALLPLASVTAMVRTGAGGPVAPLLAAVLGGLVVRRFALDEWSR